jgi:hypothetical protein
MKRVLLLCASSFALSAQTIEISARPAAPGDQASVVVSLHSLKAGNILGLQWETIFPGGQIALAGGGPAASDATKAAGKSLTCAGKAAKEKGFYSYTCILIGGQKEIPSGPIAIFHFQVSPKAQVGPTMFRVEHVEGVTRDLKKISLPDAEGMITVRR